MSLCSLILCCLLYDVIMIDRNYSVLDFENYFIFFTLIVAFAFVNNKNKNMLRVCLFECTNTMAHKWIWKFRTTDNLCDYVAKWYGLGQTDRQIDSQSYNTCLRYGKNKWTNQLSTIYAINDRTPTNQSSIHGCIVMNPVICTYI